MLQFEHEARRLNLLQSCPRGAGGHGRKRPLLRQVDAVQQDRSGTVSQVTTAIGVTGLLFTFL